MTNRVEGPLTEIEAKVELVVREALLKQDTATYYGDGGGEMDIIATDAARKINVLFD